MTSISVLVGDSLEKRLQSNVAKYNITQCNLCCVMLCQCVMHALRRNSHLTSFWMSESQTAKNISNCELNERLLYAVAIGPAAGFKQTKWLAFMKSNNTQKNQDERSQGS